MSKSVLDKIKDDSTIFEKDPLRSLAEDGQLATYIHDGFWQPMDTLREKNILEKLFTENNAKWKIW